MFKNIEQWRLIYYFLTYIIIIPLTVLMGFCMEVWEKRKIAVVIFFIYLGLLMLALYIVFGSLSFDSFGKALTLGAFLGTSWLVGGGIYYLWKGITKRGKGKLNKD